MTLNRSPLVFSCLISVIGLISIDFISPSLPYIANEFDVSPNYIKNMVLIYMLLLGLGQFLYGYMGDRYGRKKTILSSFVLTLLGITLCAYSHNLLQLYLARGLTAMGVAACPVIARAIISDSYHTSKDLQKSFSWFSLSGEISPGIAPILGGLIQTWSTWQVSFYALLILNILVFILLFKFMPETCSSPQKMKISEIFSAYISIFKNIQFTGFSILSALIYTYTIGFYNFTPFILYHLKMLPFWSGVLNSLYAFSLAVGSFSLGRWLFKINSKILFLLILMVYLVLFIFFYVLLGINSNFLFICFFTVFLAILCGIIAPLALSLSMEYSLANRGITSAAQSFIKMFFSGFMLIFYNFVSLSSVEQMILINFIIGVIMIVFFLYIQSSNPVVNFRFLDQKN